MHEREEHQGAHSNEGSVEILGAATAGVLALGLGLSACGDDDDADAAGGRRRRRRPTSGSGSTARTPRDAGPRVAEDDLRGRAPRLDAHHRAAGVGGAGREADHVAVQRLRDPRRGRGRQHPGADVHRGRRVQRRELRPRRLGRRRPAAGLRRGRPGGRQDVRRALLRRLEVHLLPQGPLRGGRHRGPDDDGRVRPGRHRPQGGQPRAGQLLRLLVPGPGLAQRRRLRLGRRRRPRRQGRRRVAGRPVRRPSRSRGSRPCRR